MRIVRRVRLADGRIATVEAVVEVEECPVCYAHAHRRLTITVEGRTVDISFVPAPSGGGLTYRVFWKEYGTRGEGRRAFARAARELGVTKRELAALLGYGSLFRSLSPALPDPPRGLLGGGLGLKNGNLIQGGTPPAPQELNSESAGVAPAPAAELGGTGVPVEIPPKC